jgi:hypothetical protein
MLYIEQTWSRDVKPMLILHNANAQIVTVY